MFVVLLVIALLGYLYSIFRSASWLWAFWSIHLIGLVMIAQDSYWMYPLLGLGSVSLLLVLISLQFSSKMQSLQPALLAVSSLFLTFGILSPNVPMVGVSSSLWVWIHLILILSGYVACIVAGIIGGGYLFVRTRLKSKELKGLSKFPPLKTLAQYNMLMLWIGMSGLSTGVLAGLLWAASNAQPLQWDMTILTTIGLLLWYGFALVAHYTLRNERWSAWFSIGGVCSLVVFFFLSAIIGDWHMGGGV